MILSLLVHFCFTYLYFVGVGQWHRYGASGASHGGTGGQGACSNHLACKLSRTNAYGDLYQPLEFGSGGSGARGGSGMFKISP